MAAPPSTQPPSKPAVGKRPDTRVVAYDHYVDEQVRSTARSVRAMDISQSVLRLMVGILAVLLGAAVLEHWVVPGGLAGWQRYLTFIGLALAVGGWVARDLWPLIARGINPLYAAQTIEQASPSLKNSLVNLLLLRRSDRPLPAAVQETVERQAAERLAKSPGEEPIDNRQLLRWGYLLVAALAVGAVYALASPKNPFTTAVRVLAPWADLAAPTRVQITDVAPGSGEAIRGAPVTVSATVAGLRPDEQPELVVVSGGSDGPGERLPLTEADGLDQFAAEWRPTPTSDLAAAEVRYRLQAGDARTPVYRLSLVTAPAISVRELRYDYQDYTGLLDRTAEGIGDIRAIEGTRVTIVAEANMPIASAQIDLQGDGRPDIRMETSGRRAEASITLALREDRRTPRAASYVLRFVSADDRANANPASYRIDVLPDLPPEATLLSPTQPVTEVGVDETVTIEAEARDPDYALSSVRIRGEAAGGSGFDVTLFDRAESGPFEGRWTRPWRFVPREHDLRAGELVTYWLIAEDTRQPSPGAGVSERRRFRIVDRGEGEAGQQERPRDGGGGQPQPRGGEPGQPQPGQNAENGNQKGPQGDPGQQEAGDESRQTTGGEPASDPPGQNQKQNQPGQGAPPPDAQTPLDQPGSDQQRGGEQQPQPDPPQQNGQPDSGQPDSGQPDSGQQQSGQLEQPQQNGQQGGDSKDQQPGNGLPSDQRGEPGGQDSSGGGQRQQQPGEQPGAQPGDAQSRTRSGGGDGGQSRGESGGDAERPPVSADGDDDGTAFQRIREKLAENERQNGRQGGKPDDGSRGEPTPPGASADPRKPQPGDPSTPPSPSGAGDTDQTQRQAADQQPQRDGAAKPPGDAEPNNDRKQSSDSTNSQSGGETGNEDSAENRRAPREGVGETGKNEAGDQGNGVAGDRGPGEDSQQPGDQRPSGGQSGKPGESERGPGQSRREGAGDQPGGQPPNQSPDKQQPGEGASSGGESNERSLDGDNADGPQQSAGSEKPGDRQRGGSQSEGDPSESANGGQSSAGDDATGEVGDRQPPGDEDRPGDEGDAKRNNDARQPRRDSQTGEPQAGQSGDRSNPGDRQPSEGQPSEGQPGEGQQRQQQPGDRQSSPGDRSRNPGEWNGEPQGGVGGDGEDRSASSEPGGDDANLDYARKQTDLVLENLSDQLARKQVDQELLDDLGWTEADLQRFVERWQARKQAAQQRQGQSQAELDKALRSLGLRRGELAAESNAAKDQMRDLRSGRRITIPAKYRDRLRRYNQGVSRGDR